MEFYCCHEVIPVFYLMYSRLAGFDHCCSTQLIDGDGVFNVAGIDGFIKEVKLGECGLSYAVVSIMGPQSSGMQSYFLKFEIFCCSVLLLPLIEGLYGVQTHHKEKFFVFRISNANFCKSFRVKKLLLYL